MPLTRPRTGLLLAALLLASAFVESALAQSSDEIVSDLRFKFNFNRSRDVDQPFDKAVAKLRKGYAGAVEREFNKSTAAGNLDDAVLLKKELESVNSAGDTLPEPPDLPAARKLRKVYATSLAKLESKRDADLYRTAQAFLTVLTGTEKELTQAGNLDAALAVRAYREKVAAEAPDPPAAAMKTPDKIRVPLGSSSRRTLAGHEILEPTQIECRYGNNEDFGNGPRDEVYIIESDQTQGRLHIQFTDARFIATPEAITEIALVLNVAKIRNANTDQRIRIRLNEKEIGVKPGARRGATLQIPLDKEAIAGNSPLNLEVICGSNAVMIEKAGKQAPHLIVKYDK